MSHYLKEKGIFFLIALMGLLIMANVCLSLYNTKFIAEYDSIKTESQRIRKAATVLTEQLQAIDARVKEYLLTKQQDLLSPYPQSVTRLNSSFGLLDSLLRRQKYRDAAELYKVERAFETYAGFTSQMIATAKGDSTAQSADMLDQDEATTVSKIWAGFTEKLFTYEEELVNQSQIKYTSISRFNVFLQIVLLIISIPTLGLVVHRIKQDSLDRHQLLEELDKNNRYYLFDPGTTAATQNPKEIIETSIQNFKEAHNFVSSISAGEYEVEWHGLNENNSTLNKNNLAAKLVEMSEQMKRIKREDEKRLWITEGQAKFAEIVRLHQNNLATLADQALMYLTKYLQAQQGSLFVRQEEESGLYLELKACYAFHRKKYLERKIAPGQGLVGQTYLEGETTLLTHLPQNYTYITSGLGDATPRCLLVVPAKYNGKVEAVIEIAGFADYAPHQIAFVEKAGEILASTLISAKNNEQMQYLLKESELKTEKMRAQEEQMRQNVEELQATQEEMERKNNEMQQMVKVLQEQTEENHIKAKKLLESERQLQLIVDSLPRGIFWKSSKDFSYLGANQKFAKLTGFTPQTIIGKTDFDCPWTIEETNGFRKDDTEVIKSKKPKLNIEEHKKDLQGGTYWVSTSKVPLMDEKGEVLAVLGMLEDITERRERDLFYQEKLKLFEDTLAENEALKKKIDKMKV